MQIKDCAVVNDSKAMNGEVKVDTSVIKKRTRAMFLLTFDAMLRMALSTMESYSDLASSVELRG